MSDVQPRSPLDRQIAIPGWYGLTAIAILIFASFVRLFRLDSYLLNIREAHWAYDAWNLYFGRPLPAGEQLPDSAPFMLIWNAFSFFLFGVTDATARLGSAVLGIGMIGLIFMLKPFLSKFQIVAIAGILTISPTVVFASRTVEPGIAAAFFAVLILVALVRTGTAPVGQHGWAIALGVAIAGLYSTGPLGVTTLLALAAGVFAASMQDRTQSGAIGTALRRIGTDRDTWLWMLGSLVVALVLLFSRMFSHFSSLAGIGTTISDWVDLMFRGAGTVPALFYFWSLLLYELFAVIIAIITAAMSRKAALRHEAPEQTIAPLLYVVWSAAALLLHTAASTRDTGSAVLVALPVLLLAGTGLGAALNNLQGNRNWQTYLAPVVGILLVAFSLQSTIGLAFVRGESGNEPLAKDVPTEATRGFIDQAMRLSRDLSVDNMTHRDPTGRFGLVIQTTPDYEWPFAWYFRDFADFKVANASEFSADTDIAIAGNSDVMDSVGLTTHSLTWIEKPGDPLTMMKSGDILRTGLNPANWGDAWNYMIIREPDRNENPRTLTIGYSMRIMNKLSTETGPYNLFDNSSPGAGGGLGQLDLPAGIDTSEDGTIYVLNAGNARVDRYNANGEFIGIWNGQVEAPLALSWNGFQGGTGLHVGPDGLIYIADTWNHAVVVVNPTGTVVRVLGNRGEQVDITDGGDPMSQQGLFFGPRDIAVTNDRIYVTDTGNERVQVFSTDGTFVTAFGGFGEADGQFIEPTGVAVAPDGNIWVADSGNGRLQVFDADGNWLESHTVEQWDGQLGIARMNMLTFDDAGTLYFTVPSFGVWTWVDGTVTQVPGTETLNPGGIALDGNGDLLITDLSSAQVVRVTPPATTPATGSPEASPIATPEG